MIKELKKIKISEVENQIKRLETELSSNKYSWLEKKIFKNKEYKEWYKSIVEQIQKLKADLEDIRSCQSLLELNMSFEEGIKLLQSHGIDPVLDENDIEHSASAIRKPYIDNIDGLVMVHKRSHPPQDNLIKTCKSAGIVTKTNMQIGDECKEVELHNYRDTIHFTVNGEVSSTGGHWYDSKYAVIIPMKDFLADISDKNQVNLPAGSAYKTGDVVLPKGSFLLVPVVEIDEQKKNNPNVTVIGYNGPNVSNYSCAVLRMQGYTIEEVNDYGWYDKVAQQKYDRLIYEMGTLRRDMLRVRQYILSKCLKLWKN